MTSKSYTYISGYSTPAVTYCYDDNNAGACAAAPTGTTNKLVGRLTLVSSTASSTSYGQYDVFGNILKSTQTTGGISYPFVYSYNLANAMSKMTLPSGRVETWSYDNANRASSVAAFLSGQAPTTYASSIAYASQGPVSQIALGNRLVEVRTYDSYRQQPIGVTLGISATDSSRLGLTFAYCPGASPCSTNNGNLLSQAITPLSVTQSYTYDSFNRLNVAREQAGTVWSETSSYDNFGNRYVSATGISLSPLTPTAISNYYGKNLSYNTKNQVAISSNFAYDGNGNQTAISPFTASYDVENRQTALTSTMNGSTTYSYDGDGRRVTKAVSGGTTTTYVYDARGNLTAEYASQAPTGACLPCFVTTDHLGSTRLLTDQNGNVVARHDFLPFGEELTTSNRTSALGYGATDNVMHKFTGKERDAETGLDYFGARYMSSAQGRFTSPDPITVTPARVADPQQLNLYAYGRNNPLKYVDPTGMIISTDDLSDKDKSLWQKVVDLANKQEANGSYVNPALHSAYAALDSDSRVFKIEDNPGLGAGTAGLFTITKFNGENDFSEPRIDLNFKTIKGINSTTTGDFDPSFLKYSGLLGGNGFIPRLAETFGHEAKSRSLRTAGSCTGHGDPEIAFEPRRCDAGLASERPLSSPARCLAEDAGC